MVGREGRKGGGRKICVGEGAVWKAGSRGREWRGRQVRERGCKRRVERGEVGSRGREVLGRDGKEEVSYSLI